MTRASAGGSGGARVAEVVAAEDRVVAASAKAPNLRAGERERVKTSNRRGSIKEQRNGAAIHLLLYEANLKRKRAAVRFLSSAMSSAEPMSKEAESG